LFEVPSYEGSSIPILPNQCWMLRHEENSTIFAEILGQDDAQLHVHIWESFSRLNEPFHRNHPLVRLRTEVQGGGSGIFVPIAAIELLSVRIILSSDASHQEFGVIRTVLFSSREKMHRPQKASPRLWLPDHISRIMLSIPNPILFSDGSFSHTRTLSSEIGLGDGSISSGIGIVIISQDMDWESLPQIGIHIDTSSLLNSSFLAELGGLCVTTAIRHDFLPPTSICISDCKGALSLVSSQKPVYGLVGEQLISRCRQRVSLSNHPTWHPSHPERRGGPSCLNDHGILRADLYAEGPSAVCSHSFTLGADFISSVSLAGPNLNMGKNVITLGLRKIFQDAYFSSYIEQRQIGSRQLYGSWSSPTTSLAVAQWQLTHASFRRTAMAQRYAWDKLSHPSHPSLIQPLSCPHCMVPSGMEHITLHCTQAGMVEARSQVCRAIGSALHAMHFNPLCQSICMILEHLSRRHASGLRIWTGLWNSELSQDISTSLANANVSSHSIRLHKRAIISFLSIFSQGLIYIWRAWRQHVLPISTSLLAKFPRLQPKPSCRQLTIRSFIVKAPSRQVQVRRDVQNSSQSRVNAQALTNGQPAVPDLIPKSWTLPSTVSSVPSNLVSWLVPQSRMTPVSSSPTFSHPLATPTLASQGQAVPGGSRPHVQRICAGDTVSKTSTNNSGLSTWLLRPTPHPLSSDSSLHLLSNTSPSIADTTIVSDCMLHANVDSPRAGIG